MELPDQSLLRNLGIVAHIDAGKTSLTERILFLSGAIRQPGTVDSGTTTTDFLPVERERGITVKAACVRASWKGRSLNLIDTPGHVDFGSEVERSLRVLDSAVVVLCAVAGVQSRTEAVLRAAARRKLPRLAFINKLDRRGASFERALSELRGLEPSAVALTLPWGEGAQYQGFVDLVSRQAHSSQASQPGAGQEALALPKELEAQVEAGRAALLEALAEADDEVLGLYAQGVEPSEEVLGAGLRRATVAGRLVPVLCGSAFSDPSVARLLDAMADYLPSPLESPCPSGLNPLSGLSQSRRCDPAQPFSGFVFKTQADDTFGRLSWVRVWSGSLKPGDKVQDAQRPAFLRVQKLFSIQGSSLAELPAIQAGDIAALAFSAYGKAEGGGTGSSLSSPGAALVYESLGFAEPVLSLALEPLTRADTSLLGPALQALLEEDPSLRLREDAETGRKVLSGMGELHLEVALERLKAEWGLRLRVGQPQVSYREALKAAASVVVDFDRAMNGERVRASLALTLEPRQAGSGHSLAMEPGLKLSKALQEALEHGLEAALSAGPAGGWPLEDWQAVVASASLPAGRQEALVLEIAASMAGREAMLKAGTVVLEPWMRVDLACPEECLGASVAVLSARGGRIESIDDLGGEKRVGATAPLRLLFGLATELRSATEGRGSYEAKFLKYEVLRGDRT